jgi:hypothetical protein
LKLGGEFMEEEKTLKEMIQEDISKYQEEYNTALNSSERAYANGKIYSLRVLLRKL